MVIFHSYVKLPEGRLNQIVYYGSTSNQTIIWFYIIYSMVLYYLYYGSMIPTLLAMVFRGGFKNVSYNFVGTPHRGKMKKILDSASKM